MSLANDMARRCPDRTLATGEGRSRGRFSRGTSKIAGYFGDFYLARGTPKSLQIFLARNSSTSRCLGTVEVRPVRGLKRTVISTLGEDTALLAQMTNEVVRFTLESNALGMTLPRGRSRAPWNDSPQHQDERLLRLRLASVSVTPGYSLPTSSTQPKNHLPRFDRRSK